MPAPWVSEEMKDVDLSDKRLNERLMEVLSQLGGHPTASIPAACGGYAEMTAAYRLFDNEKVSFENVLQPHIGATYRRMAEHPVVILAQDTTEIDVTRPEQQVAGAGPLDDGARCGALVHSLVGFTPDGTPLGTVYAEVWTREGNASETRSTQEAEHDRKHTPIEDKESVRWLDAFRQCCDVAQRIPQTQCVAVADSEADIYELLEEAQRDGSADWIIRACQDRALEKAAEDRGFWRAGESSVRPCGSHESIVHAEHQGARPQGKTGKRQAWPTSATRVTDRRSGGPSGYPHVACAVAARSQTHERHPQCGVSYRSESA